MHSPETKAQFIKLRAQGLSYARIASRLRVSKPTLIAWNRECQSRFQSPRALELKVLQESLLPEDEMIRCSLNLRAIEQELVSRAFREISTDQLHRMANILRERLSELHAGQQTDKFRSNSVKFSSISTSLVKPGQG
jgi:transposase-like protein